jgi:hypothetical protein
MASYGIKYAALRGKERKEVPLPPLEVYVRARGGHNHLHKAVQ